MESRIQTIPWRYIQTNASAEMNENARIVPVDAGGIEEARLPGVARESGTGFLSKRESRIPERYSDGEVPGITVFERQIQVTFRHQIYFTHGAFMSSNLLLRTTLVDGDKRRRRRVLVVMDQSLANAQPR